ncbi:uncharacterized protein LOC141607204 [Silene latifolia]|uniref:uncharacterized protein LOC141607204 n=1 Tax=Silene latifolia TaxID=37657 RepID=UPI003D787A4B
MYICLKPVKKGYLNSCRPIIGVDGCHLKGAYPGLCLVVVGMDGNNNIYPVAWAVVKIENGETWCWFLRLLMEDLGMEAGLGITIMSDRQKGIREAFNVVTPKAHIRFCVRHIWANFKVQFPGILFKEAFWKAARVSKEEVRDKPILTMMDWMRRYVMKKHYEKRQGVNGYTSKLMPYVEKFLKWAVDEANCCDVYASSDDSFEVEYISKQYMVDLPSQNCSCGHWQLCGLPCQHVIASIYHQRATFEDYVHQAYTKDKYLVAYGTPIPPMSGICQWERVCQVEPLPPPYRKLPAYLASKREGKKLVRGLVRSKLKGQECKELVEHVENKAII